MKPWPCKTWQFYVDPAPAWVTTEAVRLLHAWNAGDANPDTGKPFALGDHVYELGEDGKHVRYNLSMHPPDFQNPEPHRGVDVQFCSEDEPAPAPEPPPLPTTPDVVEGVHVSDAQGAVDWTSLRRVGAVFAFIAATDGIPEHGFATPKTFFHINRVAANAAGVVVGATHLFRPTLDPREQAEHHAVTLGTIAHGDLASVVVVDNTEPASPKVYSPGLLAFTKALASLIERRPIVYASADAFSALVLPADAKALASVADLCIVDPDSKTPGTLGAWPRATFWEYVVEGSVFESTIGHVRFLGSADAFTKYIQGALPTPKPPAPKPPPPTPPGGGGGGRGRFPPVGHPRDRGGDGQAFTSAGVTVSVNHEWKDHPHEPGHSFRCADCGVLSLLDGQSPRRRFYLVEAATGGRAPTYDEPPCGARGLRPL